MRKPKVISLCDYSGIMVQPWAEHGYHCLAIDTQHPTRTHETLFPGGGKISWINADVMSLEELEGSYKICFAAPPCTDLAVSGAKHFAAKGPKALLDAMSLVYKCIELMEKTAAPYMLENPVGRISTAWRQPDNIFHPCDYAGYLDDPSKEAYTKKTCLWTGNGFKMPTPKSVPPEGNRKGQPNSWYSKVGGKGIKCKNHRSKSPLGFAVAVYEANK